MMDIKKKRQENSKSKKRALKLFRHLLATGVWTYFLSSLFIFDVNNFLVSNFPQWEKYIKYKALFIIIVLALLWRFLRTKVFVPISLFVVFYPIILFFAATFRVMGISPNAFLAVVGSVMLTIRSAKKWLISAAIYFSLFVILYVNIGKIPTITAMIGIFLLLLFHYFERFYSAFRPESLISSVNRFIKTKWANSREELFLKDIFDSKKYPPGSTVYSAKKFEKIILILFFNIGYRFIADKLKRFQESRLLAVSSISKILMSLALTVVVYGFEYMALNRLVPGSFIVPDDSGIFFYLYASFNTILTMGVPDFKAIGPLAKLMTSTELIFSLLLLIILFFVFTTIVRERYQTELDELISLVDSENTRICDLLISHFDTTLEKIQRLEGIEGDKNKSQIESILKLKTEVLKITD